MLRDGLAKNLFGQLQHAGHDGAVGYYLKAYIGHSSVADQRARGASGGMATWLLERLLESGQVDRVITVGAVQERGQPLFRYEEHADAEQVRAAAGSKYYPVEVSRTLRDIWQDSADHRFAIVGLPCVVQGVRRAMTRHPRLARRVRYLLGLVCNHCPASYYTELLCGLAGVANSGVRTVAYRQKGVESAIDYRFQAMTNDGRWSRSVGFQGWPSRFWNKQFFAYNACSYCDDLFAETADAAFMDAWLKESLPETRGTSIVVVRNAELQKVLDSGCRDGLCELRTCPVETVLASQKNQVKRKKQSIRHRVFLRTRSGGWLPRMQVEASREVSKADLRSAREEALVVRYSSRLWPLFRRMPARLLPAFYRVVCLVSGAGTGMLRGTPRSIVGRVLKALGLYPAAARLKNHFLVKSAFAKARLARKGRPARPSGLTGESVLFLPPSSPGSLGDEAIETAFVAELRARGVGEVAAISYTAKDDWGHLGLTPSHLTWHDYSRAPGTLKRYDRFYVLGTDVMDGTYSEERTLARLRWASLAATAGLQTAIVNFSFKEGPNETVVRAFQRLPSGARLVARDPTSRARLQQYLGRPVGLSADVAFLLKEDAAARVVANARSFVCLQRKESRILVGVNVNPQVLGRNPDDPAVKRLANVYADTIIRLFRLDAGRYGFVFLPHDFRGTPSDLSLSDDVLSLLPDGVKQHCLLPGTPYRAAEVKAICGGLDVILSGRMHVTILGLSQAVPVVSVTYQGKFEGLYEHFELAGLTASPAEALQPGSLFTLVKQAIDRREMLGRQIEEKLPLIRSLAENNLAATRLSEPGDGC
ncbi:MAG: Coenzyme F420 hydrogenase/dehydrogenase, beta subunit C-terminal domain [bacterium]